MDKGKAKEWLYLLQCILVKIQKGCPLVSQDVENHIQQISDLYMYNPEMWISLFLEKIKKCEELIPGVFENKNDQLFTDVTLLKQLGQSDQFAHKVCNQWKKLSDNSRTAMWKYIHLLKTNAEKLKQQSPNSTSLVASQSSTSSSSSHHYGFSDKHTQRIQNYVTEALEKNGVSDLSNLFREKTAIYDVIIDLTTAMKKDKFDLLKEEFLFEIVESICFSLGLSPTLADAIKPQVKNFARNLKTGENTQVDMDAFNSILQQTTFSQFQSSGGFDVSSILQHMVQSSST